MLPGCVVVVVFAAIIILSHLFPSRLESFKLGLRCILRETILPFKLYQSSTFRKVRECQGILL